MTNIQEEIWKDIKGYEGKYQVSSFGNIKSLYNRGGKGRKHLISNPTDGRILKFAFDKDGYKKVSLYFDRYKSHFVLVHRIIAKEFIPNPSNKPQVNHKNGIKTDNSLDNLEWVTPKENTNHAINMGLSSVLIGEENRQAKMSNSVAKEILKLWRTGRFTQTELSEKFNIGRRSIGYLVSGVTWKHISTIDDDKFFTSN